MWIYHNDKNTLTRIYTEGKIGYKYNEDCDTHLITFDKGNIAFTKQEIKQLKKLLKKVEL